MASDSTQLLSMAGAVCHHKKEFQRLMFLLLYDTLGIEAGTRTNDEESWQTDMSPRRLQFCCLSSTTYAEALADYTSPSIAVLDCQISPSSLLKKFGVGVEAVTRKLNIQHLMEMGV